MIKILNSDISFKSLLLFIVFALLTFYIPFNDFGCTQNQIIGIMLVFIALVSSIDTNAMQLAFFLPYVAATAFPIFGISLHIITMLEMIFFIKVFRRHSLEKKHVNLMIAFSFYFLIPFALCSAPISGLIKYLCNFLIFVAYYYLIAKMQNRNIKNDIYFAFALGVLSSCIAGRYYVRPLTDEIYDSTISWLRYCGLWTDPNFLGCFCLTGILALLRLETKSKVGRLLSWAACAIIFYYGTLTLSRTYLVVAVLILAIFSYRSLKGSFYSYIIGALVLAVSIPALMGYVENLQDNRRADESTITNGRFDDSMALLEAQSNDVCMMFGAGCDNYTYLFDILENQQHRAAAHNSYVDIILQFGYIGTFILIGICLKHRRKIKSLIAGLMQVYGLPMACTLFYLGTLSALKYEFVYFIAAIFYAEYSLKILKKNNV